MDNVIDYSYWQNLINDDDIFNGFREHITKTLRHYYNLRQLLVKSRATCKLYKTFLVKYHLLKLARNKTISNSLNVSSSVVVDEISNPISIRTIKKRVQGIIQLLLTHNAAIGISNKFLSSFTDAIIKNEYIYQHVQKSLTPIIIRQINSSIKDWQNDEMRQVREALGYKAKHISTTNARFTRLNVCLCICLQILSS